jgi:cobalt/nickel transport system permease protein
MQPQCKVAAAIGFVLAVVLTPASALPAFLFYVLMLAAVARSSEVKIRFIARRLVVGVPFYLFALLLPLLASGERFEIAGLALSHPGVWAAWNIIGKATLGLTTTILLAATTPVAEILHGLEHLRVPRAFTAIAGFMIRYADVVSGELRRMKIARESRGYDPRWLWQGRAVAAGFGSLFIRSYERGERVYLAMISRGYNGAMPVLHATNPSISQWVLALSLPALALTVALVSRVA